MIRVLSGLLSRFVSRKMYKEKTTIYSEHAAKYLVTLCRHFARKVPAEWDESTGKVEFSVGTTTMCVDERENELNITCHASDEEKLAIQKDIIEGHVDLFSRREKIVLSWVECTA